MSGPIILDVPQGSPEWHKGRLGILTSSVMQCLLVDGKHKSGLGAGAFTLMHELIGERFTGESADTFGGNAHTARGHEWESAARDALANRLDVQIDTCGLILNHGCGYSPDGIIGDKGLAEIKTKLPKFQIEVILAGVLPSEHVAQCQSGLWISEREWLDFASYWKGMPLFHIRVYRDEATIKKLADRARIFYEVMEERTQQIIELAA